ncbi:MAG TPA: acyl-CoA desaturase, partial [Nitrospira sp.]|nr:acyl-CoA desaturase [Nitrospira sp.]
LFGYLYGYTLFDWALFAILYVCTGLGITVGYHRLISHRSFECHPWVKALLLIAGGWALQNSALRWSADHLRHHARTDQEEDPYNAQKGFWHSHCIWLFINTSHRTENYERQLRKDPIVMWQHRHYHAVVISGLAFPLLLGSLHGGLIGGIGCFFLAGMFRMFMVLNSTFAINSLCHMFGTQPHGTGDSSRDNWLVSFVSFGEGYHNYHHTYARDYRNGPRWYNFDPSKWTIYSLSMLGLATNLRRLDSTVMSE